VEESLIDVGFFGDFLHSCAGGTASDEDNFCGVEDAALGVAVRGWSGRFLSNHSV
jgi:hypothetical protein